MHCKRTLIAAMHCKRTLIKTMNRFSVTRSPLICYSALRTWGEHWQWYKRAGPSLCLLLLQFLCVFVCLCVCTPGHQQLQRQPSIAHFVVLRSTVQVQTYHTSISGNVDVLFDNTPALIDVFDVCSNTLEYFKSCAYVCVCVWCDLILYCFSKGVNIRYYNYTS